MGDEVMTSSFCRAALCTLALTVSLIAQVGLNGVKGGLGTMTLGPVNTNLLNGGNAELGIQYYPNDGRFYVTRRGTATGTLAPHNLLVIDQAGTLITTVQQGPGAAGGPWGHRDGATDGYAGGTKLFFGDETGIHCYEMTSGTPVYVTGAQTVMSANGPQSVTFPLAVQSFTGGITRALEYDPNGNGGNGSWWIGNFGVAIVQLSLQGGLLTTLPANVNNPAWSAYGLAMNLQDGMLWVNSHTIGSATSFAEIAEMSPATGIYTGRRIRPPGTLTTGTWIYAAQGGLCYVQGRTGPTFGPATSPPFTELAALTQGTPDYYALHRLDLMPGFPSTLETRLEASFNGAGFLSQNVSWTPGSTLELRYNTPVLNPGSPAICIAFVGPPLFTPPIGNTANVAELMILNNLSIPSAPSIPVGSVTLGDGFGFGGLLSPDFLIMPPATVPLTPSFPALPLPSLGGPGTTINIQAAYLWGSTPIATNTLVLTEL
jgi:hypothetical protein